MSKSPLEIAEAWNKTPRMSESGETFLGEIEMREKLSAQSARLVVLEAENVRLSSALDRAQEAMVEMGALLFREDLTRNEKHARCREIADKFQAALTPPPDPVSLPRMTEGVSRSELIEEVRVILEKYHPRLSSLQAATEARSIVDHCSRALLTAARKG